jgi:dynamin-binding protein
MPSGDSDHNYYTLRHHRSHSQQADYRQQPSRRSVDSDEGSRYRLTPTSSGSPARPLPTHSNSRSTQQASAKLPAITTTFASNARLSGLANGAPTDDDSPDPHEFYRQFRDPFGGAASGFPAQPDIVVERVDDGMARTALQQKHATSAVRSNGNTSRNALTSPRDGARSSYRSASGPPEATSPLSATRSNPNLSGTSRSQQPSLKELVNRFNQNRDDSLPIPAQRTVSGGKPESSRSGARKPPPGWKPAGKASSGTTRDLGPNNQPQKASRPTQRSRYAREDVGSTTPAPRSPKKERPKPSPLSPVVHYASRSMTHLPQVEGKVEDKMEERVPRRPLFGEILTVVSGSGDLGYGIPGYQRRGSEGNIPSPDPAIHKRSLSDIEISPSSPTAWYLGLTPSLDSIDIGKTDSPHAGRGHRRTRSDVTGFPPNLPSTASGLGVHMKTVSPSPETSPTTSSNGTATRNQHSRIPVSTRRLSETSDPGASPPATRTNSSTGGRVITPPKGQSAIPKPYRRSLSPARNPQGSPRGSSRQQIINGGLPSPSLKAYISAPAPKVSPPLRSSRPRQPISSANTASRGKHMDRDVVANKRDNRQPTETKSKTKKIPELGGVDFAARREKIQRAFTKSLRESQKRDEDEAAKRHLAKDNEEKRLQAEMENMQSDMEQGAKVREREEAPGGEVEAVEHSDAGRQEDADRQLEPRKEAELQSDAKKEPLVGAISTSMEKTGSQDSHDLGRGQGKSYEGEKGLPLDANTPLMPPENQKLQQESGLPNEDSQTLSTPNDDIKFRPTSPQDRTPRSAVSDRTIIENEPQQEAARAGRPANLVSPRHRTILSQVMQMRESSPPRTEIADDTPTSENGSIQIMLRETPIVGSIEFRDPGDFRWNVDLGTNNIGWSRESLGSAPHNDELLEKEREHFTESAKDLPQDTPDRRSPSIQQAIADQSSIQDWSPVPLRTPRSGHTTLDTEAYNAISRVLEHYHDPNFVSPEMMHDFQQQILTKSPEFARQGGWDPKRVTQLYLQELARTRVTHHRPTLELPRLELPFDGAPHLPDRESAEDAITPATVTDIEYTDTDDNPVGTRRDSSSERGWSSKRPSFEGGLDASFGYRDDRRWRLSSASLQNRDDWTDASPSVADWIAPLAADNGIDGNEDRDFPPTPPPKDWEALQKPHILTNVPVQSGRQDTSREGAETPRLYADDRPQLPELDSIGEGLGLAIDVGSLDPAPPPPLPNYSPPPVPITTMDQSTRPTAAQGHGVISPISPSIYTRYPPSSISPDESSLQESSIRRSDGNSTKPTSFAESQENITKVEFSVRPPTPTPEQRRLNKRKHVLKELVDTELSFHRDMTVTEEIYKGTSNACSGVTTEDVKVLFGNSDQIVNFSKCFLDALKQAVSTVYVLPKGSSGSPSKRGSVSSSSGSPTTEDRSSFNGPELTDDEKDRKTFVGEVFGQHMAQMEKVYGDYLKNHDAANKRLEKLQANKSVAIWLQECRTVAEDLTHAWSLDSLLVKPVQRVLKYPLLLAQLLEETPENHPDFSAIEVALREMTGVSHRINELKKRVDLVEKVIGRKRKESDVRAGISKAFGRRTEKLRQQVGLSEVKEDRTYDDLSAKFGAHFLQLQVVMRDVEMYTTDVTEFVEKFNGYIQAVEEFIDIRQTPYPEAESKWRKFAQSMREMGARALGDHVS